MVKVRSVWSRLGIINWLGIAAAAVLCLIVTADYKSILRLPGEFLIVREQPEKSDLILVLAGDFFGSRVLTGADLGRRGFAPRVLISGTPYQDTYESDLAVRFAVSHGYSPLLFVNARHNSRSTIDEALALAPELRRLGARRIILVTSDFHSRRTALVFRLLLPEFEYQTVGAPYKQFHPESWWKTADGRRLVLAEYVKMAGTLVTKAGSAIGLFDIGAWIRT